MSNIASIAIVGTGNVAYHLGNGFIDNGIAIKEIYGRNVEHAAELAAKWECELVNDLSEIKSELILVCVSDDAIGEVLEKVPSRARVAYTGGAVDLRDFRSRSNTGVFYPLQTFSEKKEVNLFEVPFLIEADSTTFSQELFDLAWKLSRKVFYVGSEDRLKYHLSAVWINNFTNHLVFKAKEFLEDQKLDFELLKPLLVETLDKLQTIDPFSAQTGPARRNDTHTIERHTALMDGISKEIYSLISKSITETYKNDQL